MPIKTISTKGELDEFEQTNIQQAIEWTLKKCLKRCGNGQERKEGAIIVLKL